MQNDLKTIKRQISKKVSNAATPRQLHFDNVARNLGFADSNIAFKHLGALFIEKAKIGAPSINLL